MTIGIPPKWKQLWDIWNIRGFILLSISLQIFLILFASLRKRMTSKFITAPLWSAYLLADWVAGFAIGLIASSDWNAGLTTMEAKNLYSFWASFLLVHLGGPDTITSFALEDNELWPRHLIGLIFQCVASLYVYLQSLADNELWIPTMLMFITGIMKYAERTRAFYLASSDKFRDSITGARVSDPGWNNVKLIHKYLSWLDMKIPARIMELRGKGRYGAGISARKGYLTEFEVVQYAYQFFQTFKGIISYMHLSPKERSQSRAFFLNRAARDGFKLVEVELNFIYDTFFTKLPVVCQFSGVICRFFSFATVSLAIFLFTFKKKLKFNQIDVMITYGLLYGALALEIIALIRLLLSDWTLIYLWESPDDNMNYNQSLRQQIIGVLIRYKFKKKNHKTHMWIRRPRTHGWLINLVEPRWSESFSTYSIIYYCCYSRKSFQHRLYKGLGIEKYLYVKEEKFTTKLRDFIYEELRRKSAMADDMETTKEIISSRGDWVLRCEGETGNNLLHFLYRYNYDQSILIWHIATELCYAKELSTTMIKVSLYGNNDNEHRKFAKLLSGYMMYLHIMKPSMISATSSMSQIQFRDACASIKNIIQGEKIQKEQKPLLRRMFSSQTKDDYNWEGICGKACTAIEAEEIPQELTRYKKTLLLTEASELAKLLMEFKESSSSKWEIISKVWLEMLCYGAVRSRAEIQISQVNKGCELITLVWLLMAHFGLSEQFEFKDSDPDITLIVGK